MEPERSRAGRHRQGLLAAVSLLASFEMVHQAASTAVQPLTADAHGTVHSPAHEVPLSSYMSEAAKQRFKDQVEQAKQQLIDHEREAPSKEAQAGTSIAKIRESVDNWYRAKVERAQALYPVDIAEQHIGGVRVHVITPKESLAASHRDRVLIHLHGGGMQVGAVWGGMAESIPVSSVGKFEVVTADYRMAPEYKFPVASEDVTSVYVKLLKHYRPQNIGIYHASNAS
jgi:monoterpene epsilon-lactone hydrolase